MKIKHVILAATAALSLCAKEAPVDTSKWKGFNLLEKFGSANKPFIEEDFKLIKELGFTFVRLPLDYRSYVISNDWYNFNEQSLKDIDQAVAWGEKYNLHVSINLHRGPGYCINPPAEKLDLWTDETALKAFCDHWRMFAKRYLPISRERLSFNLLNEPARAKPEQYYKVFGAAIASIHEIDPKRLIIVDGMNVGNTPYKDFASMDYVIQSTRGYHPGSVSHYRASWNKGWETMPMPVWPPKQAIPGYLYGSDKAKDGLQSPLILRGSFPAGTVITYTVNVVSRKATVVSKADGTQFYEKVFEPKDGAGEWTKVIFKPEYNLYQNVYDKVFSVKTVADAKELSLENTDGDWMTIDELRIQTPAGMVSAFATDKSWGKKHSPLTINADGTLASQRKDPEQTLDDYLEPWLAIQKDGVSVIAGEWGCYNKTPHAIALAWMRGWLKRYNANGIGWALWNFRGSFGILDSDRTDVQYEEWNGHKLDRKMLELLKENIK
ncbi:MAG: cellulase family glycosylhydrolase [Spirochaetes bacterium]|nr:cellulase family glycosylhydrolase [Spirochaetota bacterium]